MAFMYGSRFNRCRDSDFIDGGKQFAAGFRNAVRPYPFDVFSRRYETAFLHIFKLLPVMVEHGQHKLFLLAQIGMHGLAYLLNHAAGFAHIRQEGIDEFRVFLQCGEPIFQIHGVFFADVGGYAHRLTGGCRTTSSSLAYFSSPKIIPFSRFRYAGSPVECAISCNKVE